MNKEQYNNTSKAIARALFESNLDMDYMDYCDGVETELAELESEIESIRQTHIYLSHALDLLATMQGDETPLLNQMLAYNEE